MSGPSILADAERFRGPLHIPRLDPEHRSEPAGDGAGRGHVALRVPQLREVVHQRPGAERPSSQRECATVGRSGHAVLKPRPSEP
jgi:hypothetical protein